MSQSSSNDPKGSQTPETAPTDQVDGNAASAEAPEVSVEDAASTLTGDENVASPDEVEAISDNAPDHFEETATAVAEHADDAEIVETSADDRARSEHDTDQTDPQADDLARDEARKDDTAADEQDMTDNAGHHDDTEHQGSSFASMALKVLVAAIVIFAIAIWALPRIAPHLPDSMARSLFPAQKVVDERLARIEAELIEGADQKIAALESRIADLSGRLEAAEAEVRAARAAVEDAAGAARNTSVSDEALANASTAASRAADAAGIATSAATEAGTVASSAMRNGAALGRRMAAFEAQMTAVSDELSALGEGLANTRGESDAETPTPELVAAYNALKARLDGIAAQIGGSGYVTEAEIALLATQDDLRATRSALAAELSAALAGLPAPEELATRADVLETTSAIEQQLGAISVRLDAVETAAVEAASSASEARAEVGGAIRDASLRSAVATLRAQLLHGLPFASSLDEVARLSDTPPPEALAAVATTGAATPELLLDGFGRQAQKAIAADLRAQADGGLFGHATARLRSVVAGRPKDAVEGDTTSAILSRVEASVLTGDLAGALEETQALSEAAAGAMSDWIAALDARVAADNAISEYVAGLGGSQG